MYAPEVYANDSVVPPELRSIAPPAFDNAARWQPPHVVAQRYHTGAWSNADSRSMNSRNRRERRRTAADKPRAPATPDDLRRWLNEIEVLIAVQEAARRAADATIADLRAEARALTETAIEGWEAVRRRDADEERSIRSDRLQTRTRNLSRSCSRICCTAYHRRSRAPLGGASAWLDIVWRACARCGPSRSRLRSRPTQRIPTKPPTASATLAPDSSS